MSRRYGRNQKRAHRTRIAQLERAIKFMEGEAVEAFVAHNRDRALLREMSDKNSKLCDTLDVARSVLGEDHPAFPSRELEVFNAHDGRVCYTHLPSLEAPAYFDNMPVEEIATRWESVPVMTTKARLEEFRAAIHFEVSYDDLRWGYAVTRQAFTQMPKQHMVEKIARELALLIHQDLVGIGGRDRGLRDAGPSAFAGRTTRREG